MELALNADEPYRAFLVLTGFLTINYKEHEVDEF